MHAEQLLLTLNPRRRPVLQWAISVPATNKATKLGKWDLNRVAALKRLGKPIDVVWWVCWSDSQVALGCL